MCFCLDPKALGIPAMSKTSSHKKTADVSIDTIFGVQVLALFIFMFNMSLPVLVIVDAASLLAVVLSAREGSPPRHWEA